MTDHVQTPLRPGSVDDLRTLIGVEIGPTDWHEVTQRQVDAFAEVTDDRQWIHVDPVRAAASPLGTTIAHGLYSLARGPAFFYALLSLDAFTHSLNYGYDKVRFPAPLTVGARLRMTMRITGVDEVPGGAQLRAVSTFEQEGGDKPVCVAESLARIVSADH